MSLVLYVTAASGAGVQEEVVRELAPPLGRVPLSSDRSPPGRPTCTQPLNSDAAAGEPKWLLFSKLLLAEIPHACDSAWAQGTYASPKSVKSSLLPIPPRGSLLWSQCLSGPAGPGPSLPIQMQPRPTAYRGLVSTCSRGTSRAH